MTNNDGWMQDALKTQSELLKGIKSDVQTLNTEMSETLDRIEALTKANAARIEAMSNKANQDGDKASQDSDKLNRVAEQMARLAAAQANYHKKQKP